MKDPAYARQICQCVRKEAMIKKIQKNEAAGSRKKVMCNMSHVACHLSPTATARPKPKTKQKTQNPKNLVLKIIPIEHFKASSSIFFSKSELARGTNFGTKTFWKIQMP